MKKKNPPKISKNSFINISNKIKKEKSNEARLLFFNVLLMLVVIILVSYITVFAVGKNNIFEKYLYTPHENTVNLIATPISLNEKNILKSSDGINSYSNTFKIVNKKKSNAFYRIILVKDVDMIKKDNCEEINVPIDSLKYSLNGRDVVSLKDNYQNEEYVIMEGSIAALSTLEYNLNIWIDNLVVKDKTKKHFHGMLVLEEY